MISAWSRWRRRAWSCRPVADLRIHDLRHSFASGAVALGEGLPIIGKLLGHTQVQTTARYAHLAADPFQSGGGTGFQQYSGSHQGPEGTSRPASAANRLARPAPTAPWWRLMERGQAKSITDLAEQEGSRTPMSADCSP
jgi:hypothetical protein